MDRGGGDGGEGWKAALYSYWEKPLEAQIIYTKNISFKGRKTGKIKHKLNSNLILNVTVFEKDYDGSKKWEKKETEDINLRKLISGIKR